MRDYRTPQLVLGVGLGVILSAKHLLNPLSLSELESTPSSVPGKALTHKHHSVSDFTSILLQLLLTHLPLYQLSPTTQLLGYGNGTPLYLCSQHSASCLARCSV